jgi:glutathione peroxidase
MNLTRTSFLTGVFATLAGAAHAQPNAATIQARNLAVQTALQEQQARFDAAPAPTAADAATAYQFSFEGLMLARVPMSAFRGNVVMVVNTASECGFTPQYEGLQALFEFYHRRGFEIVGVPSNDFMGQEPGSAAEIAEFCRLNYGVTFPMAAKAHVVGRHADPFYRWAREQIGNDAVPRWNFHKILIGRDGRVIRAFPSATTPTSTEVRRAVEAALAAPQP